MDNDEQLLDQIRHMIGQYEYQSISSKLAPPGFDIVIERKIRGTYTCVEQAADGLVDIIIPMIQSIGGARSRVGSQEKYITNAMKLLQQCLSPKQLRELKELVVYG